jgi:formylglycine-generating enzyme required for sulfatase activity
MSHARSKVGYGRFRKRLGPCVAIIFAFGCSDDDGGPMPEPSGPVLAVSQSNLVFGTTESEQIISITNAGTGTLNWTVTASAHWLNLSPSEGSTSTETDEVTATVIRTGLNPGNHAATTTVVPDVGDPRLIPVDVTVTGPPSPSELVLVPAGTFVMGDGRARCGISEHEVTLTRAFRLGQHEVTNREYMDAVQWAYDHDYVTATVRSVADKLDGSTEELLDLESEIQFDGAGRFYLRESPSRFAQEAYPDGYAPAYHPVKDVTWYGAVRYCDWVSLQAGLPRAYQHAGDWSCNGGNPYGALGYRLPTDAEWEYAAQWNDERIYPWGSEPPDCHRTNIDYACIGWTSPVGSYPPAPQALGLSDMAGNILEWCNDWLTCGLGTTPVTDPVGPPDGEYKILRGGAAVSNDASPRCAERDNNDPDDSFHFIGFRIAQTVRP